MEDKEEERNIRQENSKIYIMRNKLKKKYRSKNSVLKKKIEGKGKI